MKRFLIACLLLALVISGVWLMQWRVSVSAHHLLDVTKPLEDALLAEDAEVAMRSADEFHQSWHTSNGWMYLLLPHEAMDDLEYATEYLKLCLKAEDFSGALSALSDIKHDLSTMATKDSLNWKNLL